MAARPVEPPPTSWHFPPVDAADEDGLVGVGADLEPGTLLAAYRTGLFPMPVGRDGPMGWWSPDPRGVLPSRRAARVAVAAPFDASVRGSGRHEVRRGDAARAAIRAVPGAGSPSRWSRRTCACTTSAGFTASRRGATDGELVGGLYGIAIGGFFAGESMFSRAVDASKVALVDLVERLRAAGYRLLDVQWATPHLRTLGVIEIPRPRYVVALEEAREMEVADAW